jgi:hypothetical protein
MKMERTKRTERTKQTAAAPAPGRGAGGGLEWRETQGGEAVYLVARYADGSVEPVQTAAGHTPTV